MGGRLANGGQDVFAERLKRIRVGAPLGAGAGGHGLPGQAPALPRRRRLPGVSRRLADLALVPLALALGALALVAGRIGAFHLLTLPGIVPKAVAGSAGLWLDLLVCGSLLAALGWSFSLTAGLRRMALVLGFAAAMAAEPLLYAQAPALFAALTSEAAVTRLLGTDTHLAETLAQLRALL